MTVCIAAACWNNREERAPRIVLCSDTKLSSSLGSTEGSLKQAYLGSTWNALTAGNEADIMALLRMYRAKFLEKDSLSAENIDATIKSVLYERKGQLAEEYVQSRFGRSYEYFLKNGKNEFASEHYFEVMQHVARADLGASFIIAGFIDGEAEIYYTETNGTAKAANHYAIIGEGEYVAQSALLRRQHTGLYFLDHTIYHVYEAKRLAEMVPSVGKETVITVIDSDSECYFLTSEYLERLEKWFDEYGPQRITNVHFEGEAFIGTQATTEPPKSQGKPTKAI